MIAHEVNLSSDLTRFIFQKNIVSFEENPFYSTAEKNNLYEVVLFRHILITVQ